MGPSRVIISSVCLFCSGMIYFYFGYLYTAQSRQKTIPNSLQETALTVKNLIPVVKIMVYSVGSPTVGKDVATQSTSGSGGAHIRPFLDDCLGRYVQETVVLHITWPHFIYGFRDSVGMETPW